MNMFKIAIDGPAGAGKSTICRALLHDPNYSITKGNITYKDTDIVCEDLKRVKHASKLYKKTNNKLQYWSYKQVLDKLNSLSELKGFKLIKVEPAYTSQTCSKCGAIIKANCQGEFYSCSCGLLIDADTNAAINILHRGVYSLSIQKCKK